METLKLIRTQMHQHQEYTNSHTVTYQPQLQRLAKSEFLEIHIRLKNLLNMVSDQMIEEVKQEDQQVQVE